MLNEVKIRWMVGVLGAAAAVSTPTIAVAAGRPVSPFAAPACAVPGAVGAPLPATWRAQAAAETSATGAQTRPRSVAQVTRNERVDATFEVRPAPGGGVEVLGRRGPLEVTKTVLSDGSFTLVLSTGKDRVTIAVSPQATTVTRGKAKVSLARGAESEATASAARRILAESTAVVQFRGLAAGLLADEDWSGAGLAIIIADATVGILTGDIGAPGRIAQYLGRRGRGNLRPAALAVDCFTLMETRFVEAWNDYVLCWYEVAWDYFYQNLCAWRWTLQVESYWFSFISCSGFNGF